MKGVQTMQSKHNRKRNYKKPEYNPGAQPADQTIAWFAKRGISEAVVRRNRIEARDDIYFPSLEKKTRAIAFPYIRNGEVVNVQYRSADKHFVLEKDCELVLYGIDDVKEGEPIVVVEGQIDKLSLEEAGYLNCVSVPNGANTSKGDAPWLESAEDILSKAECFILAGDNDEVGEKCQEDLARRLGPERCRKVEWPEGCKDANDVLIKHGRDAIISAIECAQPLPIEGITRAIDTRLSLMQLYETGWQPGVDVGLGKLSEIYKPRLGEMTIATGAPGMGKSTVVEAILVNIAIKHEWRFGMYSPEQLPTHRHVAALMQQWAGVPFAEGYRQRMTEAERDVALDWVNDYFIFIDPAIDEVPTLDFVLEQARICIRRHGINGLLIDPWNELDHVRPSGQSETEYIGLALSKIRRFARMHNIHVWIVAHPTKLEKREDGSYPVASLYDIAGSANWRNKADMGLSIWRDIGDRYAPVEIYVQKVRFRENGREDMARLQYDITTGALSELRNER